MTKKDHGKMKIRNGFVSNSSSSSFVIHKRNLSETQIVKILNYQNEVEEYLKDNPLVYDDNYMDNEFDFSYVEDTWYIKEYEDFIFGETSMDNFSFSTFFRFINVSDKDVCWDDGYYSDPSTEQDEFLKEERKKLRKDKLSKIDKNEHI